MCLLTTHYIFRGRNNSNISGSQQDYLVGKSGSPQVYVVSILPKFKQNNMTSTKFEKIFPNFVVVQGTTAVIIFGSPTMFLVVLGLPDYHYFDLCHISVITRLCLVAGRRTLLSEAYACRDVWQQRLQSPVLQQFDASQSLQSPQTVSICLVLFQ